MSLKSILLFISISLCYTSKAQIDTIYVDSIRKTASEFSKSVHRIELVALIPYSKTRYHKNLWLFNRKFTYYIPASIIKSSNSPDISTKIKGEMIGDRCDFDMTLKDSLFQALFYNELVTSHTSCYNPRNGILFYDEENKLIGFIEICFECSQFLAAGNTPCIARFEPRNMADLKSFFQFSFHLK
jgi:hypothetical protein